ncbi:MAG: hydantoinase B/oxoprolinase family protein [Bdellovibrionales bacterium]|nr:hydantoinase B/oxoprolinase family protein [Bdellovibrionales bacterium]
MNSFFTASLLNKIFTGSLAEFYSGALIDSDGQALALKCQTLTDIGTFPSAALISDKYMNINDGDVILLNDPYSGGATLSTMTLIMAVEISYGPRKADSTKLLLCNRVAFKPRLRSTSTIEEEGIRIPPSPIYINGELNKEFFDILESHPQCPKYFKTYMTLAIEKMCRAHQNLKTSFAKTGIKLNKKLIAEFHKTSYERARKAISDITIGEAQIELSLREQQEKIALCIEVFDDKATFDFTNTTASKTLHLTDTATLGACAGALYSCLNASIPMNAGTLKTIDVVAPQGSIVNAKYPEPVFLGLTDGVALIASLVTQLIGTIDPRKKVAQSGFSQCSLEIDFGSHTHYFDFLESGVAASSDKDGISGLDLWKRSHLFPSIEAAESLMPIRIVSNGYRQNSGGSGNKKGGNGVTRILEVLQEGEVTWAISPPKSKPEGIMGGKSASPAEIFIHAPGQAKEKLDLIGTRKISKNTQIIMNSAGGGGYGEVIETDDENL